MLWRTIIIRQRTSLARIRSYLSRSKAALLNIYIGLPAFYDSDLFGVFLDLLVLHVDRWGSFLCEMCHAGGPTAVLQKFRGLEPPQLRALTLRDRSIGNTQNFLAQLQPLFNGRGVLPHLRHVQINNISLDWQNQPFRNLTEFSLTYCDECEY